ncbi:M16 family metallopeptidase [Chitinophaga sancti]|uniref:Pitrilysin family protein n=1 Tax=Chitinophaga sancti TaxID=1004 RepID=A0A1K1P223_9BACT|nr:pitrilysin family protein [Chitinophaga sancti]WQD60422.1 pitrilysin family protein [Chitinophaga sancti]WQG87450.1 pitrilysin family protein [Chitinophaga sancti]SFW41810.1 Predicted Zn-dependent peptidase [Chitinophaga sancti]
MINRKLAPEIKDAVEFEVALKPYEKFTLDNGIPVYVVESDEQETLQLEMVFPAGSWYESENLIASAANFLMKNGTGKHSALEINESIDYYGAYLNRSCHHEFGTYTLHCLTKSFYSLLPTLQEVILDPAFSEEELALFQQNMKQRLAVNLQKCDFVANRHIDKYLFGEFHPYGRVSSMEAYDALHAESLRAFYQQHYTYNNCRIFVAGKLPDQLIPQLNQYFGTTKWNGEATIIKPEISIMPAEEKKFRIFNDENGVQGAVRIARHFPNRYHPDYPKMMVLNTIFGGYFGSRLMSNIREEKGYTYGISSQVYNFRQASAINIHTEAGRDVCEATIEEVYKEMRILQNEVVDEEEMALVRNFMIGSILADLDGGFQIIQRWKNLILNDLDENYFYNNIKTIKTISAEELHVLAKQYFKPEDWYELVVI